MTQKEFSESLLRVAFRLIKESKTNYDDGKLCFREGKSKLDIAEALRKAIFFNPPSDDLQVAELERQQKLAGYLRFILKENKQKLIEEFREELKSIVLFFNKEDKGGEETLDAIMDLCRNKGKCLDFMPETRKEGGD